LKCCCKLIVLGISYATLSGYFPKGCGAK
jgi:hypothetical protein